MSGIGVHDKQTPLLETFPTDEVRHIMWRFAGRSDLQKLVRSTRSLARGLVARLVADGERDTTQWTGAKNQLPAAFDEAGISAILLPDQQGGFPAGSKYQALALAAFELAWVDSGAAACSLAIALGTEPIMQRGTPEQKREYLSRCAPARPGEDRKTARGAVCLSEPLSYFGAGEGKLSGTVRVSEWNRGEEPVLKVNKCGRSTENVDFADFVVAAVESDDARIQGTCAIILEKGDEGRFDRGAAPSKLAHQLCSTRDPVFDLKVPASRIVGGYTVQDGLIVPRHDHRSVLEAVWAGSQVALGVMTAAKLLSAAEPIIRYRRARFSHGDGPPRSAGDGPGANEGGLHRLVDVWATGEAAASLGFAAARHLDRCDELARGQNHLAVAGSEENFAPSHPGRDRIEELALEYLRLIGQAEEERDEGRLAELREDRRLEHRIGQSVANVLLPAAQLWSTGQGVAALGQAVSLMGDSGLTRECPGFLPHKWMDAQWEASHCSELFLWGQLAGAMTRELFLAQFRRWIAEMKKIAAVRPGTGACAVGSAMELWLWSLQHLVRSQSADKPKDQEERQGAIFTLAEALCWLLAARCQILDVLELASQGEETSGLAQSHSGYRPFLTDLCHVQSARAAGEAGRMCAELVFGYNRHPTWEATCEACIPGDEIDELEGLIPGISYGARITGDVMEADGSHADKAGPCVRFTGLEGFTSRRSKLDGCLTGARLAKELAVRALAQMPIPEGPDYPA